MSSGQTANYELNQWAKSDRILMEDFNADNAKIDAAIQAVYAAMPYVFLRKIVTETDAQQVDVDISDIDWSEYRHLLMHVEMQSGSVYIFTRLNGLQGSSDYQGFRTPSESSALSSVSYGSLIIPNTAGATYRTSIQITGGITNPEIRTALSGGNYNGVYWCVNSLANPLSTVNFFANSTGSTISAGATITFYGVRV